jgi:hypothetical protein
MRYEAILLVSLLLTIGYAQSPADTACNVSFTPKTLHFTSTSCKEVIVSADQPTVVTLSLIVPNYEPDIMTTDYITISPEVFLANPTPSSVYICSDKSKTLTKEYSGDIEVRTNNTNDVCGRIKFDYYSTTFASTTTTPNAEDTSNNDVLVLGVIAILALSLGYYLLKHP